VRQALSRAVLGCWLTVAMAACGLHFAGAPAHPSEARLAVYRAYLLGKELPGYGLYSYVVLRKAAQPDERERAAEVVRAYLTLAPVARPGPPVSPWEINITYLPLTSAPPGELEQRSEEERDPEPLVAWLLDHYDYTFSEDVLDEDDGLLGPGPFLVSYPKAVVSDGESASPLHLLQDLSAMAPRAVREWTGIFLAKASEKRYWSEDRLAPWAAQLKKELRKSLDDTTVEQRIKLVSRARAATGSYGAPTHRSARAAP